MSKGYRIGLRIGILVLIFIAIWAVSVIVAQNVEEPEPVGPDLNLEPVEPEPPEEIVDTRYKVLLDAGHGGRDSGAISRTGVYEKDLNLNIVLKVSALFMDDEDIEILLVRDSDIYYSPEERCTIANRLKPDIFISVHHNSFKGVSTISGVETFYHHSNSRELARTLHRQIVADTGFKNRGAEKGDYKVTKYVTMPAVLLELGYLSNPEEEKLLRQPVVQDQIAGAIAIGIRKHFADLEAQAAAEAEEQAATNDSETSE